jgi:cytoskeletal protein RodZ
MRAAQMIEPIGSGGNDAPGGDCELTTGARLLAYPLAGSLCITSRANGHLQRMERFRWTRTSYVAALAAGAITCLVVGMLVGVLASGGHPHNVLQVITDPAAPASAHDLQPKSQDHQPALPTQSPTTVTSTTTVTAPAKTITTPTQTVTETETQTVTEPAPTTTPQTTSP